MAKKTPALVYIIGGLFCLASLVHFLSLWMVFRSWSWLRAFEIDPGTGYLLFKNTLLALGFLVATLALMTRQRWAPILSSLVSIVFTGWFWLDRTFLSQAPLPFSRHLFLLLLTLLLLGLVLLSLWSITPNMRQDLRVNPAREDDNEIRS